MGLKTKLDFREDLQLALGNRGFTDGQLDNWVQVGYNDLLSQHEFAEIAFWNQTVPITAGSNAFTPTDADGIGIIGIENVTHKIGMTKIDVARWNLLDEEATGEPKWWIRRGSDIYIWPTPLEDVVLQYETQETYRNLTLDTTTTSIQTMWDRAVHLLAMGHALIDLEEAARAEFFFNSAARYISKRIDLDDVEGRATGEPVKVIDSFQQLHNQVEIDRGII